MENKISATIFTALLFIGSVGVAQAGVVEIVASQIGNNVVFNGSGSIDLTGLGTASNDDLSVSRSQFNLFGGTSGATDIYDIAIIFSPLSGGDIKFDQITGDNFFVQRMNIGVEKSGHLGVNSGYQSNDPLSFMWTVNNETLAGLNLNVGTPVAFGNNSMTLSEVTTAVPIPGTLPMLLIGLVSLGIISRGHQKS